MKDTKLTSTLARTSTKDKSRFRRFLQSPYYNTDPVLLDLFDTIIEHLATDGTLKITKEDLWLIVRSNSPFDYARFRKYFSDILKLFKLYLSAEELSANNVEQSILCLNAMKVRGLDNLYTSTISSAETTLSNSSKQDSELQYYKYALGKTTYDLLGSEMNRGVKVNTEAIDNSLDIFYVAEKLRLYNSMLARSFYSAQDLKPKAIKVIIDFIHAGDLIKYPVVEIYYRLLNTYDNSQSEDNIQLLTSLVSKNTTAFDPDELDEIYRGILNYYVRKANAGQKTALNDIVKVYKLILEQNVLTSKGELSPWAFKNAILAGLRTEQFDWVLNLLRKSEQFLSDDYRKNALAFNYAQVYFYKKEFGKVLEYLQQVEYQDPAYALNSRNLLVAVYYELGQIDPLYSTINSFRTYLKRQKQLSARLLKGYRDLLSVTLHLSKSTNKEGSQIIQIQKRLDENPGTASRQWLQSKLDELKAGERGW